MPLVTYSLLRLGLLAATGQQLDSNAIAGQLRADIQQVRNALTRLTQAGRISRHGAARSYAYSVEAS